LLAAGSLTACNALALIYSELWKDNGLAGTCTVTVEMDLISSVQAGDPGWLAANCRE